MYIAYLKELRHNILSHFFKGLNCGLSAGKPKKNGLLRKKNTKGLILKQKGTRMAEDGEDWNGLKMTILKSLANFFSKYTNDDVAPLNCSNPGPIFNSKNAGVNAYVAQNKTFFNAICLKFI